VALTIKVISELKASDLNTSIIRIFHADQKTSQGN